MRLEADTENNLAYLYLAETKPGEAAKQLVLVDSNGAPAVVVDCRQDGAVLGIEFLDAENQLKAIRESLDEL